MNAWEKTLDVFCKHYEPESVLVRCGHWNVRWSHCASTAGAWLRLWYVDGGGEFERVVQSTIPYTYPREGLVGLLRAKMHSAEAMLESEFTA